MVRRGASVSRGSSACLITGWWGGSPTGQAAVLRRFPREGELGGGSGSSEQRVPCGRLSVDTMLRLALLAEMCARKERLRISVHVSGYALFAYNQHFYRAPPKYLCLDRTRNSDHVCLPHHCQSLCRKGLVPFKVLK